MKWTNFRNHSHASPRPDGMLKHLGRLDRPFGTHLLSACSVRPFAAGGISGGAPSTMSLMHGHPALRHAWPSSSAFAYSHVILSGRPASGLCRTAFSSRPPPGVNTRAISSGFERHLCGFSARLFTSSCRRCSTPGARPALPVQAFEGPKRYAWRQKKWHKKIDKKRPNMPPREPLPPKHPARIVQSERCEHTAPSMMDTEMHQVAH